MLALCHIIMCSVTQSCPTLYDPVDYSAPGSPVHEILQARILEWVAVLSSRGSSGPSDGTHSLKSPSLAGGFFTTSTTWRAPCLNCMYIKTHEMYNIKSE